MNTSDLIALLRSGKATHKALQEASDRLEAMDWGLELIAACDPVLKKRAMSAAIKAMREVAVSSRNYRGLYGITLGLE